MGKNIWMKELSEIKDLRGLVQFVKKHEQALKKTLLPAVVILALVLFWIYGGEPKAELDVEMQTNDEYTETLEGAEPAGNTDFGENIYVDIGGDVVNPGVYQISHGTRLFQVIEMAGGLKETADIDSINRAEPVSDGQKIIIGSVDENSPYFTGTRVSAGVAETVDSFTAGAVRTTEDGVVVNINRATLSELQMIPGVGPSTAQKILDYRNANGNYKTISDIKKISGIGDKTYENLKDYIEV